MKIRNFANIVKDKCVTTCLNESTYISTDNMLPHYGGVVPANIVPSGKATQFRQEDILLSNIRPYFRKTWYASFDGGCSADVLCIRADKAQCHPHYLYYQLASDNFVKDYLKSCKGAKMPRGDENRLLDYEIALPPIPEQLRIASILGSLDEKIEINRKKIEKLEALARMIYEHWFVQFDFPDANGNPYKSSGGAMVWNEELKQEIPDGWGVKSISDICECKDANRVPLSAKERENMCGNIPYYGATGIMDYVNQHIFDGDYLLFAEDGSIMNDAGFPIMQLISGKTWVNNHAHILSPKNGFSCKLLQLMFEKIPVCKIKTGSIQPKITQENLMGYRVLIADTSIRDKMIEKIDIIQQAIFNFKSEINNTTNLRDWLLPMLINGQVTVGE